jgi:hypothetical protein
MANLLGADYSLVEKNALYRYLDKLLPHKLAFFDHLRQRWQDMFGAKFEVLLYDWRSVTCKQVLQLMKDWSKPEVGFESLNADSTSTSSM